MGKVTVEARGTDIWVFGEFSSLKGLYTASHIHLGNFDESGPVVVGLNATIDPDDRGGVYIREENRLTLDPDRRQDFKEQGLYVNVHSTRFPAGEIRGQIRRPVNVFNAILAGAKEVEPNKSLGMGKATLEVRGHEFWLYGFFQDLRGDFTAAHIHLGNEGENGSVIFPLNADLEENNPHCGWFFRAGNVNVFTPEQRQTLRDRGFYVNVHSSEFPGGEVRGQLSRPVDVFIAILAGTKETDPNKSPAMGKVMVETRGHKIWVSGAFDRLVSDYFARISMAVQPMKMDRFFTDLPQFLMKICVGDCMLHPRICLSFEEIL